ncbi:MAG: SMP-30/gluconolactonase/LRE family protein [Acidobacteria bacterium]|nr:MAG: SMP-30/gluconolactonase/LRE family protein [Acidobacteriota bacterium]
MKRLLILALAYALTAQLAAQSLEVAGVVNVLTEGPAADADGNLYFTDVNASRILKLDAKGQITTFRQPSNRANGLVFDAQFRLLAAEGGDPLAGTPARVTRTDMKSGKVEVLADSFEGAPFRGTNDITTDGKGRIWFTNNVGGEPGGVYRIETDGKVSRVLGPKEVQNPNGLMLSLDDRTLYVIETNQAANGHRRISAWDVGADGRASNGRTFHDFYPGRSGDGMSIDSAGNLYVAAGLVRTRGTSETLATKVGVHVFSPDGKLIHHYPITQDLLTNTAFGGPDLRTLYVTAGNTVYRTQVKIPGTRR